MVLKKSKIKIPYIRLNFQIVRQSDARWCERSKISHQEEFSPTRLGVVLCQDLVQVKMRFSPF